MPRPRAPRASILAPVSAVMSITLAILAMSSGAALAHPTGTGGQTSATPKGCAKVPVGWLHTKGMWIEDGHNCKVRLASATWYGMQSKFFVPGGLDFLPYTQILGEIKHLGFNSVRIPISDELIQHNAHRRVNSKYLQANPALRNLHPLQLLDKLVAAARADGLRIILDDHFSAASKPVKNPSASGVRGARVRRNRQEATWINPGYTEKDWINDWVTLAKRYRHDPTVIGFDLRNEPHTAGPGPWSLKTYLTQGATWGPYPSKLWKKSSDWAAAATKAGNKILAVNPHLLMFVEGVQLYPEKTQKRGVETYWWGSILKGVAVDPIQFKVGHQLVYSPHEWGPWKYNLGEFNGHTGYNRITNLFKSNWAFIMHSSNKKIRAPIWLGEFNTCDKSIKCVNDKAHGSQGQWFHILMRYLQANPQIGWSYYPINGSNSLDQPSNNSVLDPTWTHPKQPTLMKALRKIEVQPAN